MKERILTAVSLFCLIAVFSCRKGDLAPEKYYGGLNINNSALSMGAMDVYMDGNKAGSIKPGASLDLGTLTAGQSGHLSIYKADSAQTAANLIADTVVVIPKNNKTSLDVLYSDLLQVKGFWDKSVLAVPSDSIRIRIKYVSTVTTITPPLNAYNIRLFNGSVRTSKDSLKTDIPLTINTFSQDITLPKVYDAYYRMVIPATGAFLKDNTTNYFFRLFSFGAAGSIFGGGSYLLVTITISENAGNYKLTYPAAVQKVN
jgi:hypothetical protein